MLMFLQNMFVKCLLTIGIIPSIRKTERFTSWKIGINWKRFTQDVASNHTWKLMYATHVSIWGRPGGNYCSYQASVRCCL